MKKRIRLGIGLCSLLLAISCTALFSGCSRIQEFLPSSSSPSSTASTTAAARDDAQIYYLDVGQADCQFIELPSGETILIDAGDRGTADELPGYLRELGVTDIDILIATHPHADHIGGMADVVENFDIGKIYMPKVADSQIPTTKTYENLLQAVQDKGLQITQAQGGMTILEQDGTKLEFFSPNREEYSDLNDYSIVTKLTYGDTSFLFTGDAEEEPEQDMLSRSAYDLSSTVLKMGHHGSSTSSTEAFLDAVNPQIAIISCGQDNDYGHPHEETLEKLQDRQITTYRTDEQGTILATTNGQTVEIETGLPSVG